MRVGGTFLFSPSRGEIPPEQPWTACALSLEGCNSGLTQTPFLLQLSNLHYRPPKLLALWPWWYKLPDSRSHFLTSPNNANQAYSQLCDTAHHTFNEPSPPNTTQLLILSTNNYRAVCDAADLHMPLGMIWYACPTPAPQSLVLLQGVASKPLLPHFLINCLIFIVEPLPGQHKTTHHHHCNNSSSTSSSDSSHQVRSDCAPSLRNQGRFLRNLPWLQRLYSYHSCLSSFVHQIEQKSNGTKPCSLNPPECVRIPFTVVCTPCPLLAVHEPRSHAPMPAAKGCCATSKGLPWQDAAAHPPPFMRPNEHDGAVWRDDDSAHAADTCNHVLDRPRPISQCKPTFVPNLYPPLPNAFSHVRQCRSRRGFVWPQRTPLAGCR